MGWEDPSESDFFQIKDHVGALALIAVNEYLPAMQTTMGTSPAIRAEIAIVDGPGAGKRFPDALVFNKKLIPQLRNSIGSTVLGRIGQGKANPGQSAPYILEKSAPGDAEKANAYVAQYGDVESKPADRSMANPQGTYAADQPQWKVQQAQQQQYQQQPQQQFQQQPQGQGYPTPPPMPQTYVQPQHAGNDEPPF